uniref:DUF7778 domain-containing protein n=1 Tax=Ascaris lumbricoides TaxID=6252 RepID=A0A9J2PVY8_ASCLU
MLDELDRLVSTSLDVCEDLHSPVQLPSVESFRQLQDGVVKIGKAMARLDNKMSCFLCCRRKWQLCQVVLLQTDTRLIIIYTDIDKGFVLDLIEAKHYEFMLEEDHEGKRQCRMKIKWEFGNVQLRFVEAQIGTWQKYVLDSFDRIFKTPRAPACLREHSEESACVGTEQSSEDFSTTESGSSRRSSTQTNRLRHYPHLEDLPAMKVSDTIHNEVCDEDLTTSSKTPQMKQLRSQQAPKHALTLTHIYESPEGIAKEAVQTETAANDEEPSKASQNNATTTPKNPTSDVQITGGSSEDGSTLSMTSGTGSPTAYEGDISIIPDTITTSRDLNFITYTLPTSYNQPTAPVASSSSTRSDWLHESKPKVPDYVAQSWQRQHQLLKDYDDDAAATSIPVIRSVKSIIAQWPPNGPRESTAVLHVKRAIVLVVFTVKMELFLWQRNCVVKKQDLRIIRCISRNKPFYCLQVRSKHRYST